MTALAAAQYAGALVRRALGLEEAMDADWLQALRDLVRDRRVDLDGVLARVVDEVARQLHADRGTLYLVDHAQRELVSRVAHLPEISEIRLRLGEGVAGWVAATGELLNVPRGNDEPRFADRIDATTGYDTRTLLAVPVRSADGTVIAVFQLLNKRRGVFTGADEAALTAAAAELASLLDDTSLRSQLREGPGHPLSFRFNHIIGDSAPMRVAYEQITRAAPTTATVLVRGESGSGKELVARALHDNSKRADGPFVVVDLAALPPDLIENELFGHVRGAFTGADRDRPGKVAAAAGGTLLLDEIGEVPPRVQVKLLRLLQERSYFPVGAAAPSRADVRFVCATHRDLEGMVAAGDFRQDLYYRLRVVEVRVPPLRARGHADLDRLIDHFLYEFRRRHERPGLRLAAAARARLHAHDWPGNVRELEHCLESAVVMARGDAITAAELPVGASLGGAVPPTDPDAFVTAPRPLREVERDYLRHVVAVCEGNKTRAAQLLGIGRNTLNRKLKGG